MAGLIAPDDQAPVRWSMLWCDKPAYARLRAAGTRITWIAAQ